MNQMQLYLLVVNQIMELRTPGMKLTRMVVPAKANFKKLVGLPKNADNLQILFALGQVYKDNQLEAKFFDVVTKHRGTEFINPESLTQAYTGLR